MASTARLDQHSELSPITVDWDLAFQESATAKGLAYWRSLCNGRPMPSRRHLSPRAMQDFLNHVNLVDVVPGAGNSFDYVVSLQGSQSREVFGHVARRRLRDILPPPLEQRWRNSFELARTAAAPVRLLARASTVGKSWLACEALLAPLGDGNGRVQTLFWVFASWNMK